MKKLGLWSFIIILILCIFVLKSPSVKASDGFEVQDGVLISYDGESRDVIIPNNVSEIGDYAFFNNTYIQSITIPTTVISIGNYAFSGCENLIAVSMSPSITVINSYAFQGCISLQEVVIPNSVTSINVGAFSGCSELELVFIPSSTGIIGVDVFKECPNLIITCYKDTFAHTYAVIYGLNFLLLNEDEVGDFLIFDGELIKYSGSDIDVVVPDKVNSIGRNAFLSCDFIKSITLQSEIDSIGSYAFAGCSSLETISGINSLYSIGAFAFYECSKLGELTLLGDYTIIPQSAFEACDSLNNLTLNENYKSIGSGAFENCISLAGFNIPISVQSINDSAFEGCLDFGDLVIPNNVNYIGNSVFKGCINLESVTLSSSLNSIGQSTFEGCQNLTTVTLPEGVEIIGNKCFESCKSLVNIELPQTIKEIGDFSFSYSGVSEINFPDGMNKIGENTFKNSLTGARVTIPRSVISIGNGAFDNCENIEFWCYLNSFAQLYAHTNGIEYQVIDDGQGDPFLVIDEKLIAYMGFERNIEIPSGVTIIESSAFEGNLNIETIIIPDSVSLIKNNAFKDCRNLIFINMPKSILTIEDSAFYNCISLDKITIEKETSSIGVDAFSGCQLLTIHGYFGSEADNHAKANGIPIIYLPDDMLLEQVILSELPERIIYDGEGFELSAYAYKYEQKVSNVEFRVSYRLKESPWWTYVSSDYSICDDSGLITQKFYPISEGEYYFRIEAKTIGRDSVDVIVKTEKIGIYFDAFPANEIKELICTKSKIEFSETIGLNFEIELNEEFEKFEYQVSYSKNNLDWVIIPGNNEFLDLPDSQTPFIEFSIPSNKTEGMYYIKLNIRAKKRKGIDQTAVTEIYVFNIMPLNDVELENLESIIVYPKTGIELKAIAIPEEGYNLDAQYKFFYSKNKGVTYKAITGWIDQNTVLFKTKSEGEYLFKVEAKTRGRSSVDKKDFMDSIIKIYIGGVPAHDLRIETDKVDYKYGEKIKVMIDIEPGLEGQKTQYLIQYSLNGRRFKTLPNQTWQSFPDDLKTIGDINYAEVLIPCLLREQKQFIKVLIKTEGRKAYDQVAICEVNMSINEQISNVVLEGIESPVVQTSQGVLLTAHAFMRDSSEAFAEYRFLYKKQTSSKWSYISSKFSYNNKIYFKARSEGTYSFKVEARTAGIALIGDYDGFENVEVYIGGLPTKGIEVSIVDDKTDYLMHEQIKLNINPVFYEEWPHQDISYQVMYSSNGRSFKVLQGYDNGEYDGIREIILPYSKKDIKHYIKVNIKTADRIKTDAYDIVSVNRYHILPLDEAEVNYDGISPRVVGEEGIILNASGFRENIEKESEFRFLYKLESSDKWSYVSSKFNQSKMIIFNPKKEGRYNFKVQARTLGRNTIDISNELSNAIGLYFNYLPAVKAGISIDEKQEYEYRETIPLEISAIGNRNDEPMEYQIVYSTNNKRFKATSDFKVWKVLNLADGKASINYQVPQISKDKHYYIKVNIRTKGRNTVDVFDTYEVDMYKVMPLENLSLSEIEKSDDNKIIITAIAEAKAGYEQSINPQYRFYYKKSSTTKWLAISGYIDLNTCVFAPTSDNIYDFKVVARNFGRSAIDAADYIYGYEYIKDENVNSESIDDEFMEPEPTIELSPSPSMEPSPSPSFEPIPQDNIEPSPSPSHMPISE